MSLVETGTRGFRRWKVSSTEYLVLLVHTCKDKVPCTSVLYDLSPAIPLGPGLLDYAGVMLSHSGRAP